MIIGNQEVKSSLKALDKKHIFVVILAIKQLCVHPMILLKSTFEELDQSKIEDSSDEENRPQIQSNGQNGADEFDTGSLNDSVQGEGEMA